MFTAIKSWLRRLFGKGGEVSQKPIPAPGGSKLSREDKRQIETLIVRAKRDNPKELSAQDSIPFERMYPDGICRVSDHFYTKSVQFQDIN